MNRRAFLAAALLAAPVARPLFAQDEEVEGLEGEEPGPPPGPPQVLEVRRIWNYAQHNAFTSLALFNGGWYCAFREGNKHVSPDGGIRVLRSYDQGTSWYSIARLADPSADLRDPKLSVTPDHRLMLTAAAATPNGAVRHRTMAWFSPNAKDWSQPVAVGEANIWLWGVTWHKGIAYGVGYDTAADGTSRFARLYSSADGVKWETLVDELAAQDAPSESSLIFDDDGMATCLVRRDAGGQTALIGTAKAPYKEWKWQDLGRRIGGPALIRLPDGRLIAVVRLYDGNVRTAVCEIEGYRRGYEPDAGELATLTELFTLPSGGDTGYAGLMDSYGGLCVSYYSSHEGKAAVYFAKVDVNRTEYPQPKTSFYAY